MRSGKRLIAADVGFGSRVLSRYFREAELVRLVTGEVPGVLVDVGAHVGSFAVPFARRGWRIVAFEPEWKNFRELRRRLEGRARVVFIRKAVWRRTGDASLYVSEGYTGIHSLRRFHASHQRHERVELTTLQRELSDLGVESVTVLKIDVEGAELAVLEGLDFCRIAPRIIICEFMDARSSEHFGYTSNDLVRVLEAEGYSVFISEWSHFEDYTPEGSIDWHRWKGLLEPPIGPSIAWGNLFALRDEPDAAKLYESGLRRRLLVHAMTAMLRKTIGRLPGTALLARAVRRLRATGERILDGESSR